jgi:hypothetical protein
MNYRLIYPVLALLIGHGTLSLAKFPEEKEPKAIEDCKKKESNQEQIKCLDEEYEKFLKMILALESKMTIASKKIRKLPDTSDKKMDQLYLADFWEPKNKTHTWKRFEVSIQKECEIEAFAKYANGRGFEIGLKECQLKRAIQHHRNKKEILAFF